MDHNLKCTCGKTLITESGGVVIVKSVSVIQLAAGFMNLRCRNCKRWIEQVDQKILTTRQGENKWQR